MDTQALLSKKEYWIELDKKYAAELEKLLQNEGFTEFYDVIRVMLEQNCRLEQEAFLIG